MAKAPVISNTHINAFLCVTATTRMGDGDVGNPPTLFGEPLIQAQIERLHHLGISRFWIGIETLPGAIVALVDRLRQSGLTIDFVRSPQELSGKLGSKERLFVQSEGILAEESILREITASPTPVIATLDSRDDNACFERIDLNTRWAGLALVEHATIDGIAALPDGWDIASSLLRQALQDQVLQKKLKQEVVKSGRLQLIRTHKDGYEYARSVIAQKSGQVFGAIESKVFAPVINGLVPRIWEMPSGRMIVAAVAMIFGLMSVTGAFFDLPVLATATSLVTIFMLAMRYVINRDQSAVDKGVDIILWMLVCAALLLLLWHDGFGAAVALFPGIVIIALQIICLRLPQREALRYFEPSPAFVALGLLSVAVIGQIIGGVMLVAMAQLAFLWVVTRKSRIPE